MNQEKKISIVFSVFNEQEVLNALYARVAEVVAPLPYRFELIFVDDGSVDRSLEVIRKIGNENQSGPVIALISLSRNFGHEAAMMAGIDYASGDAVICMDADLQHPPDMIPGMIASFESGNEIVTMVRSRNEGVNRGSAFLSLLFYRMFNQISRSRLQENASDFFLISARIATILRNDYRERNRFLRGIIQIIGFRSASLKYVASPRPAGKTRYSFIKLTTLTLTAFTSFSKTPLFLGIWFGFIFSAISIVLGIYSLWTYFFGIAPPSGYTTMILFLSISFSVLFFLLGIMGIYVGYLFEEQKKRPLYHVRETLLLTKEKHEPLL